MEWKELSQGCPVKPPNLSIQLTLWMFALRTSYFAPMVKSTCVRFTQILHMWIGNELGANCFVSRLLFVSYLAFILYSTIVEGIARYKPAEEYAKLSQTKCGKLVLACSITRNWIRLKTINSTPEIEKLRHIQGLRFVL